MIHIPLSPEFWIYGVQRKIRSVQRWNRQEVSGYNPALDKNDSWYAAAIGERMFSTAFPEAIRHDQKGFDFRLGFRLIEVKTSRRTRLPPAPHLNILVPMGEAERAVDIFVFCWLIGPLYRETDGWVVGWLPRDEFLETARQRPKGYIETSGFVYRVDSYLITVGETRDIDSLKSFVEV